MSSQGRSSRGTSSNVEVCQVKVSQDTSSQGTLSQFVAHQIGTSKSRGGETTLSQRQVKGKLKASQVNVNLNKILQVVLLIFLQLKCKWILKKY